MRLCLVKNLGVIGSSHCPTVNESHEPVQLTISLLVSNSTSLACLRKCLNVADCKSEFNFSSKFPVNNFFSVFLLGSNIVVLSLPAVAIMILRRLVVAFPCSRRFFSSNCSHDFASAIGELNKEMESVFGEAPPSNGFSGSVSNDLMAQEVPLASHKISEDMPGLTHIGQIGEAQMVDVSPKENTRRTAVASCKVILGKKVFDLVLANQMSKGDVLSVAKIAGISGAKHTSSLIPLCHNITLTHVRVDLRLNSNNFSVDIEGEAVSTGKTGVEMEAMTAVSVAGLTVYDMCKAASKDIQITDVRLDRKTGGKSGDWCRDK